MKEIERKFLSLFQVHLEKNQITLENFMTWATENPLLLDRSLVDSLVMTNLRHVWVPPVNHYLTLSDTKFPCARIACPMSINQLIEILKEKTLSFERNFFDLDNEFSEEDMESMFAQGEENHRNKKYLFFGIKDGKKALFSISYFSIDPCRWVWTLEDILKGGDTVLHASEYKLILRERI